MVSDYDAARLLWLRAGWLKNEGRRNTRETSLAKWFATVASERAAGDAVQIHGANGYSDEYPVGRFYRNCKARGDLRGHPRDPQAHAGRLRARLPPGQAAPRRAAAVPGLGPEGAAWHCARASSRRSRSPPSSSPRPRCTGSRRPPRTPTASTTSATPGSTARTGSSTAPFPGRASRRSATRRATSGTAFTSCSCPRAFRRTCSTACSGAASPSPRPRCSCCSRRSRCCGSASRSRGSSRSPPRATSCSG